MDCKLLRLPRDLSIADGRRGEGLELKARREGVIGTPRELGENKVRAAGEKGGRRASRPSQLERFESLGVRGGMLVKRSSASD